MGARIFKRGTKDKIKSGMSKFRKYFIFFNSFQRADGVSLMSCCQDKLLGGMPFNFFSTASAKGALKGDAKKLAKMEKEKKTTKKQKNKRTE